MPRLSAYRSKRDFERSPEPAGKAAPGTQRRLRFVVHKHRASHLHYDFRLEWDGVLLSWAIPKGPSLDPDDKRFARQVEDHPLEYGGFEGVIPRGQYGGGTVMVWDRGRFLPDDADVGASLRAGKLRFQLTGEKLRGAFALVRMQGQTSHNWLLMKLRDRFASKSDVTVAAPCSVKSGRNLAQIARAARGDVAHAADADPPSAARCSPAATKPTRRKQGARRRRS